MVLLHVKKNEESLFLYETSAQTDTNVLLERLVQIYNARLRVVRLCTACEDLCEYGIFKPPDKHGYSDQELQRLAASDSGTGIDQKAGLKDIIRRDGREYLDCPDPTGRRNGEAPLEELANVIKRTLSDARAYIAKENVMAKTTLTYERVQETIDNISGAVIIAYPMGLPEYDPVREILENNEDLAGSSDGKEILDLTTASLWWANKEIVRGKKLADFIGKNEKTMIVVKLQKRGQGPPMREPPLNESAQKEMMAFYYKKQEQNKQLAENDEDDYVNSAWANPKALKSAFSGVRDVKWQPR